MCTIQISMMSQQIYSAMGTIAITAITNTTKPLNNVLLLLLYFYFLLMLYNLIKLYASVSNFIFSSVLTILMTTCFSMSNVLWIFQMVFQRQIFLRIRLYILVFLFLNRILWLFCVFVGMHSILFVHYSFYIYCIAFLVIADSSIICWALCGIYCTD